MRKTLSVGRLAAITVGLLFIAAGIAWYFRLFAAFLPPVPANSITVISPYRFNGTWVFDDPRAGLVREPFVGGVPEMIDVLVADIPNANKGFRLTFSAREFPGHQKKLTWVRGDSTGNWYRLEKPPMEGWLCPSLFRYYREAPKELYVRADPKQ
jgi:hypothetical protein